MSRTERLGLTLALALLAPWTAAALEAEDHAPPGPGPATDVERGAADVQVDLEGSAPGPTEASFRASLTPHGEWLPSPRYGSVWRPRAALGWRPYFYGSWLWTDEGWYWSSDEPFAWAVYHYGRWVYDPAWGWVWIPGYQWAPAWVTWRVGGDVIGWAPLGPGVSVYVTAYPFIDLWWTFVPTVRFVGVPIYSVAYAPRETHRWFRATEPAPPRATAPPRDGRVAAPARSAAVSPAWGGPSRRLIEERSGRALVPERPRLGGAAALGSPRGTPEPLRAPAGGERPAPATRRPDVRPGESTPTLRAPPAREPQRREVTPGRAPGTERAPSPERAPAWERSPSHERQPGFERPPAREPGPARDRGERGERKRPARGEGR
jgi:hypothetical protein